MMLKIVLEVYILKCCFIMNNITNKIMIICFNNNFMFRFPVELVGDGLIRPEMKTDPTCTDLGQFWVQFCSQIGLEFGTGLGLGLDSTLL